MPKRNIEIEAYKVAIRDCLISGRSSDDATTLIPYQIYYLLMRKFGMLPDTADVKMFIQSDKGQLTHRQVVDRMATKLDAQRQIEDS